MTDNNKGQDTPKFPDEYEIYKEMEKALEKDVKEGEEAWRAASFSKKTLYSLASVMQLFFSEMLKAIMIGKGFRIVLQYKPKAERSPFIMYREKTTGDDKDEHCNSQECEENQG